MTTFLKKISCGYGVAIEFPSEVKLRFGISATAYISFVISKRDAGKEVIFEKGKVAGNPYETWRLEISNSEFDCGLSSQILDNNSIYDYRIAVYADGVGGSSKFYLECYLLTNTIFSFENEAYRAVVLYYAPGYYVGDSSGEVQTARIPFSNYHEDLVVNSDFLKADNAKIFGYDYVIEEHGGVEYLVFKSGSYGLEYDSSSSLWIVPKNQLVNGEWNYRAEISSTAWEFSTHFGWVSDFVVNDEIGVAMRSYRRGFSYETEPSASGWTFGEVQTDNFNYESGIEVETSDSLVGGPTQRFSELQNEIKTTTDPNWEIFKSRYYDRYNLRGFQLNGVERIVNWSSCSLKTVGSPVIALDSNLGLFIQNVELEVGSSSNFESHICKNDILNWTAVIDAQSRNISIDWTIPEGYTAHWVSCAYSDSFDRDSSGISFSPSDFSDFSFALDVPVGLGRSDYFENSSWMEFDSSNRSWFVDNPELMPITKQWALPKMFLESSGTYWVLAGFMRGGETQFIQEGDSSYNIIDIANDPTHYLWNVGNLVQGDTTGENILLNNLDGDGPIKPLWGRAQVVTLTFSFDSSSSSSYVPPSSSSSGESSSGESSSSWNDNWATVGYLQSRLQEFVTYMGQIGKSSTSADLTSTSEIVSAMDTVMENVGGLSSYNQNGSPPSSGGAVTVAQVRNSFRDIENRFGGVADIAYVYGSATGTVISSISEFSSIISNLNGALIQSHSENPVISEGAGAIAFKSYVDDVLSAEIGKYSGIAANVISLKSEMDSSSSIGLVYLGNTLVGLCDLLRDFGSPMDLNNIINVETEVREHANIEQRMVKLVESSSRDVETRQLNFKVFVEDSGVEALISDYGNEVLDESRYELGYVRINRDDYFENPLTYPQTSGRKNIKLIVPTYLNYKQAHDKNWETYLGGYYDEQAAELYDVNLTGFEETEEIGFESIYSDAESIFFWRMYSSVRVFSSMQKVIGSHYGEWRFHYLEELILLNPNLVFFNPYANFGSIGYDVRKQPPFDEWKQIYPLAGIGTRILLSIGVDDLMGRIGFPFGALTKSYFECQNESDPGYVIYNGTAWIKWTVPQNVVE